MQSEAPAKAKLTRPSLHGGVLAGAAIAFGLPSLAYPFGHDQGLYFYVGREWLHGYCPYRDVFDHKTPGIYVLHLLSIAVFGEHTWAIRVADLVCVLALGAVVARIATPRGRRVAPGSVGFAAAVASMLHYGFFNYWDTAQSELWYTTLGLLAIACATRVSKERVAALGAGAAAGLALVMKPPSLPYVAVAAIAVAMRAWNAQGETQPIRSRVLRVVTAELFFAVAAAAPISMTIGYFAARGGLTAMIDIVVGANSYYVAHEKGVQGLGEALDRFGDAFRIFFPVGLAALLGLVAGVADAIRRKDAVERARWSLALAVFVASIACVGMQQKFYWLHWLTIIGALAVIIVMVSLRAVEIVGKRMRASYAWACVALFWAVLYSTAGAARANAAQVGSVQDLVTGRITRAEYASRFFLEPLYYYEVDVEAASRFIKERARPGDTLCSRGFNPEVYALSGLRYGGRFFWTNFLVDPRRAYRRAEYVEEDRQAFERSKPRFVVAVKKEEGRGNVESAETYYPLGYRITAEFGTMQVLERTTDAP